MLTPERVGHCITIKVGPADESNYTFHLTAWISASISIHLFFSPACKLFEVLDDNFSLN